MLQLLLLVLLQLLLLLLLLLLLMLLLQLLLPLLLQQVLLLLFLFLLLSLLVLFLLPLLLHGLLLLLLDGTEPSGPRCPPLDSRDLGPFVYDAVAHRRRAIPRFITNSDWVAHSPKLGRLGGSLLVSRALHPIMTGGW